MHRQWLIVAYGYGNGTRLYSLPDLQLRAQIPITGWCPRADSAGMIYMFEKSQKYIGMLEISNTGDVSLRGNLTAGGQLLFRVSIAVGPQPGQLCAGNFYPPAVYILDIKNDTIEETLVLPPEIRFVTSLAALESGQILLADYDGDLVWYKSASELAVLLTDTPATGYEVTMLGNINQFLITAYRVSQLYVMDGAGTLHVVDALNGESGVWLPEIKDVAVSENCLWAADYGGCLVLLCPV